MEPSPQRAGPLGRLHACWEPGRAQLERAPLLPSVAARKGVPRSPPEHSSRKCESLGSLSLRPHLILNPLLVEDQPDPDPGLQDFYKGGYKHPICPSVCGGGEGGGLSGIHLQRSWGTSCSRARGPSEKAATVRRHASCPAFTSSSLGTPRLLLRGTVLLQERGGRAARPAPPQRSALSGCSLAREGLRWPQL